jgi:hypothetical protein
MTRRHWRRLSVATCLLMATTLSACSDVFTSPRETVDLSEWGSCLLCGGPGRHPGIEISSAPQATTRPTSPDADAMAVVVRPDGR